MTPASLMGPFWNVTAWNVRSPGSLCVGVGQLM